MKTERLIRCASSAILALTLSPWASAIDSQTAKKEFKLPEAPRYLTDEQIQKLVTESEKTEIRPNEYTPYFLKYFHIEIKTSLAGSTYERQILDMTQSYFGLTIGDKVDDVVSNFAKYSDQRKFFVGLNVKASIAPPILEPSAKKEVDKVILNKVRDGAVAAAAIKVKQSFETVMHPQVALGGLTEEEYQSMLAENLIQTKAAVSNNQDLINFLAQTHIQKAHQRIDAVVDELILQELSVKFAVSPLEEDNVIIFGTVGKAPVNPNMKQGLRAFTAFGGWANIGQTTQGTGQIQIGVQTAITKDIKMTFESWWFHNRLPTRSGSTLLFNVVAMPDDVFAEHQRFEHINSNLQKITIERPSKMAAVKDSVYVSTGDFNGDRSFGAGAIVRVRPKISVQVEGSTGREAVFQSALMEALLYHVNDKLTLFISNENVNDLKSGYHVENPKKTPGDLGAAAIGGHFVYKWNLDSQTSAGISTTGEFKCFYKNTGFHDQDQCGFDTSVTGQLNWQ